MDPLAVDAKCFAAGTQHMNTRRAPQDLLDQLSGPFDHVLAIVKDHEHVAIR